MQTNNIKPQYGKVFIAGFGPGNPELLTIKTSRLLDIADIIYHDDLLDAGYLDRFSAEKVYVGKRKGRHSAKQDEINSLLLKSAQEGKTVVRLKGGDPLIFGRGAEEYYFLTENGVDAEIVPGITSAISAAVDAIAPLTSRGTSTSVAFTLGHDAQNNKLPKADTLVFYMGATEQKKWAKRLINEGWAANTPVAAVRNASLPNKEIRRYTLEKLVNAQEVLPAPCIVIVGYTASDNVKAHNRKWLYTGSDINNFKAEGIVIHNPMIQFCKLSDTAIPDNTVKSLNIYDRIVFASPVAVKFFFSILFNNGIDTRSLGNIKISSLGVATSAELKKYGLLVEPETKHNSSQKLIEKFAAKGIVDENIMIPCSTEGFDQLPAGLTNIGNSVDAIAFYENILPTNAVQHNLADFYGVVFTSPTSVKNFFKFYDNIPGELEIITQGKFTTELFNKLVVKRESKYIYLG